MAQRSFGVFARLLAFGIASAVVLGACGGSEPSADGSSPRTKNAALPGATPQPIARITFDGNMTDASAYLSASPLAMCTASPPPSPCNESTQFGSANGDGFWSWKSTSPRGGGFTVTTKQPITAPYSVGLRFELSDLGAGYRKIIDYANQKSDNGFYFLDSQIMFYPQDGASNGPAYKANTIVDLVATLTPDRLFTVYAPTPTGGMTKLYSYLDSGLNADPAKLDAGSILGFFFDDQATPAEASPSGRIYDLRLWNVALTDQQVNEAVPTTSTPKRATTTSVFANNSTTSTLPPGQRPTTSVFRDSTTTAVGPTSPAGQPGSASTTTTTATSGGSPATGTGTTVAQTNPASTTTTVIGGGSSGKPTTTTTPLRIELETTPLPGRICQKLLPVTNLLATPTDPTRQLSWTQPAANNGLIDRVAIQMRRPNDTTWLSIRANVAGFTSAVFPTWDPSVTATLRVINVGKDNCTSGPSDPVAFAFPATPTTISSTTPAPPRSTTTTVARDVGFSCRGRAKELAPTNLTVDDTTFPYYTLRWQQPDSAAMAPLIDELTSYGSNVPPRWTYRVEVSANNGKKWRDGDLRATGNDSTLLLNGDKRFLVRVTNVSFGRLFDCKSEPSNVVDVTRPEIGISCRSRTAALAPTDVYVDYSYYPRLQVSWRNPSAETIKPLVDELTYYKDPTPRTWNWNLEFSTDNGNTWRGWDWTWYSELNTLTNNLNEVVVSAAYPSRKKFLMRVVNTSFGNLRPCKSEPSPVTEVEMPMVGSSCVGKESGLAPTNLVIDKTRFPRLGLKWTQPSGDVMKDLLKELAYYRKPVPDRWTYTFEVSTDGGTTWRPYGALSPYLVDDARVDTATAGYLANPYLIRVVNVSFGFLQACRTEPSNAVQVERPALGAACVGRETQLAPRNVTATRVGTSNSYRVAWTQPTAAETKPLVDELKELGRPAPRWWTASVEVSVDGGKTWRAVDTVSGANPSQVVNLTKGQVRIVNLPFGELRNCKTNPSPVVSINGG